MNIIIGNIISFLAAILLAISGIIKEKDNIIHFQIIPIVLFIISNALLKGISGVITNTFSLIKNVLYHYNMFNLTSKIIISILSLFVSILWNNLGFIGYLPLFSLLINIWIMDIKNVRLFKYLIAFTSCLWLIYDLNIKNITAAMFDFLTAITFVFSTFKSK